MKKKMQLTQKTEIFFFAKFHPEQNPNFILVSMLYFFSQYSQQITHFQHFFRVFHHRAHGTHFPHISPMNKTNTLFFCTHPPFLVVSSFPNNKFFLKIVGKLCKIRKVHWLLIGMQCRSLVVRFGCYTMLTVQSLQRMCVKHAVGRSRTLTHSRRQWHL